MDVNLFVVGGKANKSSVALKLPTVVGRSREADLTVSHPMISRRHCEIFEAGGLLKIRDLGSLNGTLVAGRRITEATLRPGDEFTVGPLTFRADYEHRGALDVLPAQLPGQSPSEVPDFLAVDEPAKFAPGPAPPEGMFPGNSLGVALPDTVDWQRLASQSPAATGDHAARHVDEGSAEREQEEPKPSPPPVRPKPAVPPIKKDKDKDRWSSDSAGNSGGDAGPTRETSQPSGGDASLEVASQDSPAPKVGPDDDLEDFLSRLL